MPIRRIIVCRHGQTELNLLGVVQGSGIDPSLNEEGRLQARLLFAAFSEMPSLVVSSGMRRANETAAPFVEQGVPLQIDERLREICWGTHEGKVAEPWMRHEYAELMRSWESGDYDARMGGGESAKEMAERLSAAWSDLTALATEKPEEGSLLVVMHGRSLRCLICLIEGMPLSQMNDYGHANAGYYSIEMLEGIWTVTARNQIAHLDQAGAPKPVEL